MSDALVADRFLIRLTADWEAESDRHPKAGDLVRIDPRRQDWAWSSLESGGYQRQLADLEFERNPALTHKDFPALLSYYFYAHGILPNLEPFDIERGLDAIAAGASLASWKGVNHVMLPGSQHSTWARAFVGYTQGGVIAGDGYMIVYRGQFTRDRPHSIYKFRLCDHAVVKGASARPERGWHPARCSRCGLDLTVDSSD